MGEDLRLQPLGLALLPKLVDRPAEQHQLVWVWLSLPIERRTSHGDSQLLVQPRPVARLDFRRPWWVWDKRNSLRCFVVSLYFLRAVSFRSGGVREALFQALTNKQFPLGVAVRKTALLQCSGDC